MRTAANDVSVDKIGVSYADFYCRVPALWAKVAIWHTLLPKVWRAHRSGVGYRGARALRHDSEPRCQHHGWTRQSVDYRTARGVPRTIPGDAHRSAKSATSSDFSHRNFCCQSEPIRDYACFRAGRVA